jgi:hypothetical protein
MEVKTKPVTTAATRPARQRKAVITVSERAAARVSELMAKKDPRPLALRLGVRTRGWEISKLLENSLSFTEFFPQVQWIVIHDELR